MANSQRAGYGCRQTMTVGNTPATGGQSEFLVQPAATTITMQKGNPISMQTAAGNGSLGFVMDAAQNTMSDGTTGGVAWTTALPLIQGVFNGATFVDPTGKPTWTNGLTAGQLTSVDYNTGSANITAFANTNPNQEYTVRCAAGPVTNAIFNTGAYNLATAGAASNGQSTCLLSNGAAVANGMWTVVRGANVANQNDFADVLGSLDVIVTLTKAAAFN
jgi:hypothetical protein